LVLELKDSMTGETLARATERRQAENTGPIVNDSNRSANRSLIKRQALRWAISLRAALDKMLGPN
jgi:hypothetical protein